MWSLRLPLPTGLALSAGPLPAPPPHVLLLPRASLPQSTNIATLPLPPNLCLPLPLPPSRLARPRLWRPALPQASPSCTASWRPPPTPPSPSPAPNPELPPLSSPPHAFHAFHIRTPLIHQRHSNPPNASPNLITPPCTASICTTFSVHPGRLLKQAGKQFCLLCFRVIARREGTREEGYGSAGKGEQKAREPGKRRAL